MKTIAPLALVAAIACCAAPYVSAQESGGARSDRRISVAFKGGTLSEFLELIRAGNDWVNIVASPEAKAVTLPELSIKNAGVMQTLQAVAGIVTSNYSVSVSLQTDQRSEPVHSVRVMLMNHQKPSPTSRQIVSKVFSLRFLLQESKDDSASLGTDAVLTAIDTGLGVEDGEVRAKIKFHQDSGLLFVRGTFEQTGMISSILDALRSDLTRARARAAATKSQKPSKRSKN